MSSHCIFVINVRNYFVKYTSHLTKYLPPQKCHTKQGRHHYTGPVEKIAAMLRQVIVTESVILPLSL